MIFFNNQVCANLSELLPNPNMLVSLHYCIHEVLPPQ